MHLPTEIFDDVIVVHTPQELGADQADDFEIGLKGADRHNVVLDLDATELLDSKGLTALLDAQEAMREQGGDVKVATSNATNRKILEITRLDRQIEVFTNVLDAVKSFH